MAAPSASDACVIGIDFGTLSGRALVVRVADGEELGSAVHSYAHGVIDEELPSTGAPLPPQWALQDPEDWLEVLRRAIPAALLSAGVAPEQIVAVSTDFTASTPLPVLADGTPLCGVEELAGRPHAYPKLWKHHAAQDQADRITALALERDEPWLKRYGGRPSSGWGVAQAPQGPQGEPESYARTGPWVGAPGPVVSAVCGRGTRPT